MTKDAAQLAAQEIRRDGLLSSGTDRVVDDLESMTATIIRKHFPSPPPPVSDDGNTFISGPDTLLPGSGEIPTPQFPSKDIEDEWSKEIWEAHPLNTKSDREYTTALEMVGHRHSKYALVDLVNWLLVKAAAERAAREKAEQWKDEDPRMLREQIRVADAAYNSLHERWLAAEAKAGDVAKLRDALQGMSELCGNYFDESQLVCARDREIWQQHLEALASVPADGVVASG